MAARAGDQQSVLEIDEKLRAIDKSLAPPLPDVVPDFTASTPRIAPDGERLFRAELQGAAIEARERLRWLGSAYDRPQHERATRRVIVVANGHSKRR